MSLHGPSCSFCNRHSSDVGKIISGPGAHICNECLDTCQSVLEKDGISWEYLPPKIGNALLRCNRHDEMAAPLFERVSKDLDLWVWELGPSLETSWDEGIRNVFGDIAGERAFVSKLKEGSEDFTLHLAIASPGCTVPFVIPNDLMKMAADIGFSIEIHIDP